ncbi:hypothetical protein Y032_0042g681 [Ancylostoma ceylanicum]|uniref:C2H2-type domain-containing protein n=1 Tax=Ancylostoma ceylanicum TaxID=53326 RepID=A0A016UHJ7_9BILA|nr:hypothetical protein Y032_0042g681 [Ancylostoma ceylanicum]
MTTLEPSLTFTDLYFTCVIEEFTCLGVKPYHCGSCGSSFHARARFAVHLSKYHKMSIRDYSCVSRLLKHPTSNNDSDA